MAKTFITSGTGASQTLDAIQNEKVPVYNTRADAEADLANIEEGGIVATKDTGATEKVVDVVQDGNMNPVTSNAVYDVTDNIKMKFIHITWGPVTAGQSYTRSAADLGLVGKQLLAFAEAETGGPNAYDNHRIHIAYASNVFSFDCTITQGGCSTYGVIFYR